MKLNVSYCSADDYGAYLLWITIIVLKDVYKNKGSKDPRSNSHHHEILILSADLFINCSDLFFGRVYGYDPSSRREIWEIQMMK